MKLFANVLIAGTLVVFLGCKKIEDYSRKDPASEVQPAIHNESADEQQQTHVLAVESTTPTEYKVVVIVREFVTAIDGGDYNRAIGLSIPNEFEREVLIKINKAFDFSNIGISEVLVGSKHAAVLIDSVSGPSGTGQFVCPLMKSGDRWLIYDAYWLPRNEVKEKWLASFELVEPNAKRVVETD